MIKAFDFDIKLYIDNTFKALEIQSAIPNTENWTSTTLSN